MKKYIFSNSVKASTQLSSFRDKFEAVELIRKVVDRYYIDYKNTATVDRNVSKMDSIFRGDPNWDKAYSDYTEYGATDFMDIRNFIR